MLTLINGSARTDAHTQIIDRIETEIRSGRECFLIVPEQQTVEAESEAAKAFDAVASRFFEVTNFTRFADRAFRELGGIGVEKCDTGRKQILMWSVLNSLSGSLCGSKSSHVTVGAVEKALNGVREIQMLGISADELAKAKDNIDGERLRAKITDLSAIISLYEKLLSENAFAVEDEVERLADALHRNPYYLADKKIFIEGFTSFTKPQEKLLGILIKNCDVTVATGLPAEDKNAFEYRELSQTRERLRKIGNMANVRVEERKATPVCGDKPQILDEIPGLFWRVGGALTDESLQTSSAIRIFEAADPFEECEFLAADILSRVMKGDRYSDFAVIARRIDSYRGILDVAVKAAGIPLFCASNSSLTDLEGFKVIDAAYRILTGGFKRDDVIAFLKCGFVPFDGIEQYELELYIEKWQIDGPRFLDEKPWTMNPDGFTDLKKKNTDERLERIHASRQKLMQPLLALKQENEASKTVYERAVSLYHFLKALNVEEQLKARAVDLDAQHESEKADENRRLYGLLMSGLDMLVLLCRDVETDLSSFAEILRLLFGSMSIGSIPALADSVTAGSADRLRLSVKKHIYLLGVNEGRFPALPEETSYFTDREKALLAKAGLDVKPESDVLAARELYSFTRAFCFANSDVTMVYSKADAARNSLSPATVIDRIQKLTDGRVAVQKLSDLPPSSRIGSADAALAYRSDAKDWLTVREALRLAGMEKELQNREQVLQNMNLTLSEPSVSVLYKDKHISLSSSRIEKYLECPMQYFCQYDLELDDGQTAAFNAATIGSFYHSIFENFFRMTKEKNISAGSLSQSDREKMVSEAASKYLSEYDAEKQSGGARLERQIGRLKKTAIIIVDSLCDEFSQCEFKPTFFELKIKDRRKDGKGKETDRADDVSPDSLEYTLPGNGTASVSGIIDRVDIAQDGKDVYVRVIDYKTGIKEFKPSELDEGKNLQMFLYLDAIKKTKNAAFKKAIGLQEGGEIIPAGVFYIKASSDDASLQHDSKEDAERAVKKDQKRLGMVCNDEVGLEKMNPAFLPISITKSGEIDARKKQFAYSRGEWDTLMGKVQNAVVGVAQKMQDGDITASANAKIAGNSICTHCRFGSVCRNPCAGREEEDAEGGKDES